MCHTSVDEQFDTGDIKRKYREVITEEEKSTIIKENNRFIKNLSLTGLYYVKCHRIAHYYSHFPNCLSEGNSGAASDTSPISEKMVHERFL